LSNDDAAAATDAAHRRGTCDEAEEGNKM